ncbi:hypothetical protein SKAU_G00295350, partial [Synaphobranchus kaupii]
MCITDDTSVLCLFLTCQHGHCINCLVASLTIFKLAGPAVDKDETKLVCCQLFLSVASFKPAGLDSNQLKMR